MADPAIPDRTRPPNPRRSHLFVYIFFAGLAGPISDVVHGRTRSAWLAGAALVAFATCFVLLVELSHHPGSPGPSEPVTPARRRISRVLFAAMTAVAVAATISFGHGWLVLFMFVVAGSAFAVPLRWVQMAIVAVAAIAVAAQARWNGGDIATAVSWALSIGLGGFLSLLMRKRAVLIQELRTAQGEVARLAAADAVIDERLRFARDLHDLLGHSLSVIALKAELARRLVDPDRARAEVADIEQIARRALDEVREAVSGYRARSLAMELERARAALEAAGVAVTVRVAPPALPRDVDDLLAWVVREAATNIVRHSRAQRAEIALDEAGGIARLEITNDGVAPATRAVDAPGSDAPGSGLVGLRERVTTAGGELTAAPEAGGRFRLAACVPLPIAAADREPGATAIPRHDAPALRDEAPR